MECLLRHTLPRSIVARRDLGNSLIWKSSLLIRASAGRFRADACRAGTCVAAPYGAW